MNVKRPIVIAILGGILALAPSAPAADEKPADPPRPQPDRQTFSGRVDRLNQVAEQLKLSDEQREKLKPIFQEEAKRIRELRQNKELSRQDRVSKLRENRKEI